jgi:steroid delta-isomerase-like uncharacterized protein
MQNPLETVLYRHLSAENKHDLQGTLATLHPDCVFQDHATGQVWHGRAGAADHYTQWWRAFDVEVGKAASQSAYWATDTTFIAEAIWRGTHIGEFLGIAPTHRKIVQPFVVFVGFKDGLMLGERFYYDLTSLVAQLGDRRFPELSALPHRDRT